MQQNYQTSRLPTVASQVPSGDGAAWANPSRITADDGSSSTLAYFSGGDNGAAITGSAFDFNLPPGAAVDGITVLIDGTNVGCYGDVILNITGTTSKPIGALNGSYGGTTDLWGATEIDGADIAAIEVTVDTGDISGGDGTASIDYMSVTVFWHLELTAPPADVPTRMTYKVYSRGNKFLGELPNVTSKFAFTQDINTAGASLPITCETSIQSGTTTEPLLIEDGNPLEAEDGSTILATIASIVVAQGSSPDEALFKNSNRIKALMYNRWHPNGIVMFSGQVNKVSFRYGNKDQAQVLVYSDGLDMANYIARGYPFTYSDDQTQTTTDTFVTVYQTTMSSYDQYGQTFQTGGAVTNEGAIALLLRGSAQVTVRLWDAPNGNLIGSLTKSVSHGTGTVEQFEFAQLLEVASTTSYFFDIAVAPGQSIDVFKNSSSVYANGTSYRAQYAGGSGGGTYTADTGDLYFVTKYGTPTTTATYTSEDPITGMMSGVLLDYNARGGYIKERNFQATGLSLTYTFNMATIVDVQKKTRELAPTGYYSFVDLGTAEMDMLPTSATADFTIVRGRDVHELNLSLSIEQVKNNLFFIGGEDPSNPPKNLFRQYTDPVSASQDQGYGLRMASKSDNRVTLTATAGAIGDTFIAENADESQETTVTVLNSAIDITKLTPGKTIGFRNYMPFIDSMILPIVRREFFTEYVVLTLGSLPVTMNAEIQRINRDLLNQQTVDNPTAPG